MEKTDREKEKSSAVKTALGLLDRVYPGIASYLRERLVLREDPGLPSQGYRCWTQEEKVFVEAADRAGYLYGILAIPEQMPEAIGEQSFCIPEGKCFQETPYILKRGIKFNLPLDARTPSYSDASDSAFETIPLVWTKEFWRRFLDEMASNRYNVLTLWSLSPFPSMVVIPEFPRTALWDVKRSSIPPKPEMSGRSMFSADMKAGLYPVKKLSPEEKVNFWRWVMEYAAERCIEVYLFTWNLFVYGTEDSGYGITESQRNPVTRAYLYCAVKAMLETYPLLRGIGITAGENMEKSSADLEFLRDTYGRAVEDFQKTHPERRISLIHRLHYSEAERMEQLYEGFSADFAVSFKYSQAHMYSSPDPDFFRQFVREHPGRYPYWLTLRDDDNYLYRWGDWEYARAYVKNLPVRQIEGFYMGADGFTWGMDFTSRDPQKRQLYLEKMWFKLRIWGQLAFCPERKAESLWMPAKRRLGAAADMEFADLWREASGILPLVNCVHWHDYDFQWYPEGCCCFLHPPVGKLVFASIREFMSCPAMPGSGFLSVMEYCRNKGRCRDEQTEEGKITPLQAASEIGQKARRVLRELAKRWDSATGTEEYQDTLADIRAMALLGLYYSHKLEAAVELCRFRLEPDHPEAKERSVALLKQAAGEWCAYSAHAMGIYRPQRLSRLRSYVDFSMFDRAAWLDVELAETEEGGQEVCE